MKIDYKDFFSKCQVINITDEDHWHELRAKGLGGSDIASFMNLSQYKSPHQLYQEKAGIIKPKQQSSKAIDKGNRLEPVLFELFKALYGDKYHVIDTKKVFLKSNENDFMTATLDGALINQEGKKGVLEIKTTTIQNMQMLENWKKDSIPIAYYLQCLHYLMVTDFDFAIVFALLDFEWKDDIGKQETVIRIINRTDVEDDIKLIIEKEKEFWNRVENKNPPEFISKKIDI